MSNLAKNLLLALTLVCVITLIVFCIQLIIINRGVERLEPGATISDDSQQDAEDIDDNNGASVEENGEDTIGDPGAMEEIHTTPRPVNQGTRRELMVTSNSYLVVYSKDELFDFERGEIDYWFLYTGGGIATFEVSFAALSPQGLSASAEAFLNNYAGENMSVATGEQQIHGSSLVGYHVSANVEEGTYEAWLITLDYSDLALVLVIFYENELQREALYEMMSTIGLESGQADSTPTDYAEESDNTENEENP